VVGREGRWGATRIAAASRSRHVHVVGGGPAGLKLAETAAQQGHHVTLVERGDVLGGQMHYAGRLPHRGAWLEYVDDLSASVRRQGVEIELGVEATVDNVRAVGADLTVVATGAEYEKTGFSMFRPDRVAIPGAEGRVLDPIDVLDDPERCGPRVVIIDDHGDHAALGLAQLLGEAGREVHIVTMHLFVGAYAAQWFHAPGIYYPMLAAAGVQFVPSTTVMEIGDGAVQAVDVWTGQAREIGADTVVMNLLRKSREELYFGLRDAGLPVRRIGDCVAPRQVDEAVYEGLELGLELERAIAVSPPPAVTLSGGGA
jgi:pyruvate/2-oxoglutarate dehydrogenase complex dihydrolipoamide dehydrogenase (E3) component